MVVRLSELEHLLLMTFLLDHLILLELVHFQRVFMRFKMNILRDSKPYHTILMK